MCGIVGFISDAKNAIHNVKHGLKTLEYRGYDSAGIAYLLEDGVSLIKAKGEVSNLFKKLDTAVKSSIAIGHTRWATHGEPNETNAHPHMVGDVILVHNGIIENYKELSEGYNPVSQTDTEIAAGVINSFDGTLLMRLQQTLPLLKGSYAFVAMSPNEPDKIVLACKQSPLVIGVCEKGAAVASDIYALIGHASEAIVMKDGQTAELASGSIKLYDANGNETRAETISIMSDVFGVLGHQNHDTYMHKEIFEQPEVIRECWERNLVPIMELVEKNQFQNKKILLTACGTSYHACLTAQIYFESKGIDCDVRLASELRYYNRVLDDDVVMVAVSQSGETADTLEAIKLAKEKNVYVLTVINRLGSTMTREADASICTWAGPEISVASTKSFTAQVAVLFMLANALVDLPDWVYRVPELMEQVLQQEQNIAQAAKNIYHANSMFFLGRGYGVPIAQEGALKLKEISYVHAEAYPAGELKHGPIALIHHNVPCIFIADRYSNVYPKVLSNIEEVKARGAFTIAVVGENDELAEHIVDKVIKIPEHHESATVFTASVVLQLLAYHVADLRGCNIDKPRNLAKSVTVE